MNFEEVMQEITSGLTGDKEKDFKYLSEKAEEYKNSEYNTEIERAIGRMIFDLIPEEDRKKLEQMVNNENIKWEAILEEAKFNYQQKDFVKAEKILKDHLNRIEEINMFHEDSVSMYFCFNNVVEELLWKYLNNIEKDIRRATEPLHEFYLWYGMTLIELKRIDEARDALQKSIKWNPMYAYARFEYAETFKLTNEMDRFLELTKEAINYLYQDDQIARAYRNIAFYYSEKKEWEVANACINYSLNFDNQNKSAMAELYFISQGAGKTLDKPNGDELVEIFNNNNIPIAPTDDIVGIGYALGNAFDENNNPQLALVFFELCHNFTGDDELNNKIKELEEKLKEEQ